jgi:hypothetical protein
MMNKSGNIKVRLLNVLWMGQGKWTAGLSSFGG